MTPAPMILSIETSWEDGSLALLKKSGEKKFSSWRKKASHSEVLTGEFQNLISGHDFKDIEKIAVNVGPGSFTGIRVGLAFANALAYAHHIPLIPCNSLEIMAFKSLFKEKTLIAVPAVRGYFYVGGYEWEKGIQREILTPTTISHENLSSIKTNFIHFVDGSLAECKPNAEDLLNFIGQRTRSFTERSWNHVKPLYLRRSEAEEKLSAGLLKPVYTESEKGRERLGKKQGD